MKPHTFSTLFCEFVLILPHPFSAVTTTSELFSDHLSLSQFSQLFSTALKVFHLFQPLNSFHFFPAFLNSSQRLSPLPTSSQLFSPRATSSQLFPPRLTSAQPISPLAQLISTLVTSCQLFSTLASSSQLFSPLFTEMLHTEFFSHTEAFTQSTLLHLVRTKATQIAAPKPDDLDAKAEKRRF